MQKMIKYTDLINKIKKDIGHKGFCLIDDEISGTLDNSDSNASALLSKLDSTECCIEGYKLHVKRLSNSSSKSCFVFDYSCSLEEVTNVTRYLDCVKNEIKGYNKYFRGQNARYDINPSLFRRKEWVRHEMELNARVYNDRPRDFLDCNSTFDKLVRLKHYNQPSRLLDVTSNPLVALYFACCAASDKNGQDIGVVFEAYCRESEEKISVASDTVTMLTAMTNTKLTVEKGRTCKISCFKNDRFCSFLKQKVCDSHCISSDEVGNPLKKWEKDYIGELQYQCKKEGMPMCWDDLCFSKLDKCILVKPPLNTDRIIRQSGAFIMCGMNPKDIYVPPESLYGFFRNTNGNKRKVFYVLPRNKDSLLKQLDKLGINEYFIFPELENEIKVVGNSV